MDVAKRKSAPVCTQPGTCGWLLFITVPTPVDFFFCFCCQYLVQDLKMISCVFGLSDWNRTFCTSAGMPCKQTGFRRSEDKARGIWESVTGGVGKRVVLIFIFIRENSSPVNVFFFFLRFCETQLKALGRYTALH